MPNPKNRLRDLEQRLYGHRDQKLSSGQGKNEQPDEQPVVQRMVFDHNEPIILEYLGSADQDVVTSSVFAPKVKSGSEIAKAEPSSRPIQPEVVNTQSKPVPSQSVTSPVKTVEVPANTVESQKSKEAIRTKEFLEDLQAIANGQKTYDGDRKQVMESSPTPAQAEQLSIPQSTPPVAPPKPPSAHDVFDQMALGIAPVSPAPVPTYSNAHSVFDQMGQSRAMADVVDVEAVSSDELFDEFDRMLEDEEKQSLAIAKEFSKTVLPDREEQKLMAHELAGKDEIDETKEQVADKSICTEDLKKYLEKNDFPGICNVLTVLHALGKIEMIKIKEDNIHISKLGMKDAINVLFRFKRLVLDEITQRKSKYDSIIVSKLFIDFVKNKKLKFTIQDLDTKKEEEEEEWDGTTINAFFANEIIKAFMDYDDEVIRNEEDLKQSVGEDVVSYWKKNNDPSKKEKDDHELISKWSKENISKLVLNSFNKCKEERDKRVIISLKAGVWGTEDNLLDFGGHQISVLYRIKDDGNKRLEILDQNSGLLKEEAMTVGDASQTVANYIHQVYVENPIKFYIDEKILISNRMKLLVIPL